MLNSLVKNGHNNMTHPNRYNNFYKSLVKDMFAGTSTAPFEPFSSFYTLETREFNDSDGITETLSKDNTSKRISFSLGGFKKDQVNLYEKDNTLVVIAKKHDEFSDSEIKKQYTYILADDSYGVDDITEVKFQDGSLNIYMRKRKVEEKADNKTGRKIPID